MKPQHKCMECMHTIENMEDTPESILQSGRTRLCIESPPTSTAVVFPNGAVARIVSYPVVNAKTVSCGRFACETGRMVMA